MTLTPKPYTRVGGLEVKIVRAAGMVVLGLVVVAAWRTNG